MVYKVKRKKAGKGASVWCFVFCGSRTEGENRPHPERTNT